MDEPRRRTTSINRAESLILTIDTERSSAISDFSKNQPCSSPALQLQYAPPGTKRRPSLASPLPPTPIVPSTPLPRANSQSRHHLQPPYQHLQRPSTAPSSPSTSSPDPPSTRGMMKRLLAKPAPPFSAGAGAGAGAGSVHSSSMPLGLSLGYENDREIAFQTNEHEREKWNTWRQDQDPVQEITISSLPPTSDSLLPPQSPNEFDKSIRALDLVGQIDISMTPCITPTTSETHKSPDMERTQGQEPHMELAVKDETVKDPPSSSPTPSSGRKQRNVLRRKPSGNYKSTPPNTTPYCVPSSTPIPSFSELSSPTHRIGQQTLRDDFSHINEGIPSTPSTTISTPLRPPPLRFPRHEYSKFSSPSTHRPIAKNPSDNTATNDSSPHPILFIQPNEFQVLKAKATPNNDDITPPIDPTSPTNPYSHSPKPLQHHEVALTPSFNVFDDTSGGVGASGGGGGGGAQSEDGGDPGGAGIGGGLTKMLTRTVSGKWKKHDSDHHIRSKSSVQEVRKLSVDKDGGTVGDKPKKSPDSPGSAGTGTGGSGDSPNRRFWKIMKKISVKGLREKYQTDFDHPPPPPVPTLPNDPINNSFQHQHHTLHTSRSNDSSLVQPRGSGASGEGSTFRGLKQVASTSPSALVSLPTTGKVYKTTPPPSVPSTSTQKSPHSSSSQPTTGPRPSTTTRSSSHSSDVASSGFFNHTQSARSSTSSFGEEMIPLPPLPTTSIITVKSNDKMKEVKTNDASASRKLQQYIIPPSELIRNHSTSNFPTISSATSSADSHRPSTRPMPISIQPRPSMDDDWTIVRSPSVELEALPLPPPPRRLGIGLKGLGVGLDRKGIAGGQSKMSVIPMLKMVNISSEKVDEKGEKRDRDVSSPSSTPSDRGKDEEDEEKPTTSTKSEQEDKGEDVLEKKQSHSDHDSDRSQSPTIPSFSTSSVINTFPARRLSSSLSATSRSKGSPIAVSPTSSISRGPGGGVSPMASGLVSPLPLPRPSRSPQRPEARGTFERVRQHLFRSDDIHAKAEEDEEDDEDLNPLPSSLKSETQIVQPRRHHRHSSGSATTITKSRSTHTAAASSISTSTPSSPIITFHRHRRSMSFNTLSPTLSSLGLFTSARSPSSPSSLPLPSPASQSPLSLPSPSSAPVSASQMTSPPPPLPPVPPVPPSTPSMGHRTRSSSNLRSGFSGRKLSGVFFSSASSSAAASGSASSSHPSSASGQRSIATFMSRTIGIGANNHTNHTNAPTPSQRNPPLTDQQKADKWEALLARSARAGGTLHLDAGNRLLDSDDI